MMSFLFMRSGFRISKVAKDFCLKKPLADSGNSMPIKKPVLKPAFLKDRI